MKRLKHRSALSVGFSVFFISVGSFAAERNAVEISIGGIGPAADPAAVQKVRRTIGNSISAAINDKFLVRGYGFEGGFSACVEKSPFSTPASFDAFVARLRAIKPNPDTTAYSVETAASCDEPVFCAADVKMCADGSSVSRVPPSCEFAACPDESR